MAHVSLNGEWNLVHFPQGQHPIAHPNELEKAGVPAIAARVPGNVELDLVRAGILEDPFFGDNIHKLRPFEFHEWWYSREFKAPASLPADRWDLVFHGLDTVATVWFNGVEVGRAANMFIEHRFDVTHVIRPGKKNRVDVRIESPLEYARRQQYDASLAGTDFREEMLFLRKAPHMGGWDIMPRALSAGLWRDVTLEPRLPNAFEQLYYWTAAAGPAGATLGVRFQFRTDIRELDDFVVRFHGACGDHSFDYEWPTEFVAGGCHIEIPGARLWWPKGCGKPNLYTVSAQLWPRDQLLSERVDRIGLRTVSVDRTGNAGPRWMPGPKGAGTGRYDEDPEPSAHFVIRVNGHPIMAKGSNWVPLDAFHSRDAERLDAAVALYDDLGCNMIRCWGGNVYEDHRFFDLCDEKGILVWQDFALACGRYPQTDQFFTQVRAEVQAVVEKLRNHPSLALWCGDNEIDAVYHGNGLSPEHNRINREVIPQVVHRCDPRRHYVPSSPYIPPNMGDETPEQHLWGPRGYYKSPFYTHHNAHFIGEIGYHGCPNVSSIQRFIPGEHLWPCLENPMWHVHDTYHWRHARYDRDRIKLMANQVREVFGTVFESLEEFALASQIVQAEAKKFFIESTRLRKWRTSGILWWNVIDGWPQFSDAIVDYYFCKKLAYHFIRRVQLPVCVIVGEAGAEKYRPLVVANDSLIPADVEYCVSDAESRETLAAGRFTVPANQNWQVARLRAFAGEQRLLLIRWSVDGIDYGNHYAEGSPPFSLGQWKPWLDQIAALPQTFDADSVAR